MARQVKYAFGKSQAHQVLAVVNAPLPHSDGRIERTQRIEFKKACLSEAGHWFTQADTTPLLMSPLLNIFWGDRFKESHV